MSLQNKIYKNDVGTIIKVDVKTNIADATVKQIRCKKPNGTEVNFYSSLLGSIGTIAIASPGSGYAVGNELTVVQSGGSSGVLRVTSIDISGGITGVSVYNGGSNYYVATGVAVTGGLGIGFTFDIVSLATSMILKYVVNVGDFDQAGVYVIQAYVETPSWKGLGEALSFEVYDKFM